MTIKERILLTIQCVPGPLQTECWEWRGYRDKRGYGHIAVGGRNLLVHRVAHIVWKGPIPHKNDVHHVCFNEPCCNPDHLEALTHEAHEETKDKSRNGDQKRRQTECIHGHPFDAENTVRKKNGSRSCRKCAKRRDLERTERRRAKLLLTP